jgi:ribonuclease P protein component
VRIGGARLRRSQRLRDSRDYRRLGQEGARRASAHFVVVMGEGRGGIAGSGPVLGITVSKKVGTAVERNRVKRRIREWFRRNYSALSRGVVIVVIARRGAAELGAEETERELGALLR